VSAEPIELIEEPEDELLDAGPSERDLENEALTDDTHAFLDREAENGAASPRFGIETWAQFCERADGEAPISEEEQARLDEELADHGWDHLDPRDGVIPAQTGHAPLPDRPGSFADRVASRRVDLVARLREGIPPADYLPASAGMLRRGKRHHLPAMKKVGKSISTLSHCVDIALAGGRVVIFDRENGGDLYAERLGQIIAARGLSEADQNQLAQRIQYFEYPRFRDSDEQDLIELCAGADLVVFDSQRMYLSDLGLEENGNDDHAAFLAALIDPLFRAGMATLVLDNAGHQEPKRGRGASAKSDLNEINFSLETIAPFDLETTGRIRLEIENSRFGTTGRWEMEIGGGVFGSWRRIKSADNDYTGFRPTELMERASNFVENCAEPVNRRPITDAIGGKGKYARLAIDILVREGYFRSVKGDRGAQPVESIKPYRQADDPLAEGGTQ
jgi:AAA domain